MIIPDHESAKFIDATLIGGPHDGQHVRVPSDEDHLVYHDDAGTPHRYHRLGPAAVFHYETKMSEMFGGGR